MNWCGLFVYAALAAKKPAFSGKFFIEDMPHNRAQSLPVRQR